VSPDKCRTTPSSERNHIYPGDTSYGRLTDNHPIATVPKRNGVVSMRQRTIFSDEVQILSKSYRQGRGAAHFRGI
jgi:hypothetical protein